MFVAAIVFKGEHHGFGISYWIDRVVPYYGLFDLCTPLAGEILAHQAYANDNRFAGVRSYRG